MTHRAVVIKSKTHVFAQCLDCGWKGDFTPWETGADVGYGCTIANRQADIHVGANVSDAVAPPRRRVKTIPVPRKWR